jgi:excisionase family DNA binding protein
MERPQPVLLTVPEAARVLGIGRSTLYELIARGAIETVHIGRACRVPTSAIEEFVESLRRSA